MSFQEEVQKLLANRREERKQIKEKIEKVRKALVSFSWELAEDFDSIVEYYSNELGLANYAADRCANPEHY
ncbi:MAG: hypothetical protein ACFFDT_00225 [Candidatus Hodarchaeota archaeon]